MRFLDATVNGTDVCDYRIELQQMWKMVVHVLGEVGGKQSCSGHAN